MMYSCFDAASGLYNYFESAEERPINSDLPIPSFSKSDQSRVGVPSIKAARPFPKDAKHVGSGWHARGMIVSCPGEGSGLGDFSELASTYGPYVLGALAGVGLFLWWRAK